MIIIEVIKWLIFFKMVCLLGDAFYRLATERDVYRDWKTEVTADIIFFIIDLLLFIGLMLGW